MGFMDNVLSSIKYNNNDDYDDDYDDYDDYDDEPKRGSSSRKSKPLDDEEDYDAAPAKKPSRPAYNRKGSNRTMSNGVEVVVIKPTNVEDAREITDTLRDGHTVVLNMEGLDMDIAQRVIDFTSGSTYAIDGNLQKISHYIFIVTPSSVEISGDFQEILSGGFDSTPSLRNKF